MKIVLLWLTLVAVAVAELPSYIKPCSRDDPEFNKCFVDSANEALKTLTKGDKKLKIPAVAPLLIYPGAKFEPNDELFFEFKESNVTGLDSMKILEAKADFKEKTIYVKFQFNVVELKGTYVAKALKETDEVEDKVYVISTDNHYVLVLKYDVKDNHINIVSLTVEYDGKPNIEFRLDNLDKHPTIKALWKKSHVEIEKTKSDLRGKFFSSIFEQVFKAATYDEIFPPKP